MIEIKEVMKKLLLLCALILSGCATGYQSAEHPIFGMTGGFVEQEGPGELIEVVFGGNGFIEPEKVNLYLKYRCAELVKERGGNYFVAYRSIAHAIADQPIVAIRTTQVADKPLSKVYILMEEEKRPRSFSAQEIIEKHTDEVKGS
ncbi:CC0125/CC1285 family lipoprotein [Vibrio paucivorans]